MGNLKVMMKTYLDDYVCQNIWKNVYDDVVKQIEQEETLKLFKYKSLCKWYKSKFGHYPKELEALCEDKEYIKVAISRLQKCWIDDEKKIIFSYISNHHHHQVIEGAEYEQYFTKQMNLRKKFSKIFYEKKRCYIANMKIWKANTNFKRNGEYKKGHYQTYHINMISFEEIGDLPIPKTIYVPDFMDYI